MPGAPCEYAGLSAASAVLVPNLREYPRASIGPRRLRSNASGSLGIASITDEGSLDCLGDPRLMLRPRELIARLEEDLQDLSRIRVKAHLSSRSST